MNILKVTNLKKTFRVGFWKKAYPVLHGVNFAIEKGTVTGFLGKNGSGKTTTIKSLLGLILPDSGEIEFFGETSMNSSIRSRIGFLPERPYFYDYLTGEEFLQFYGQISGAKRGADLNNRIDELLALVDLSAAKKKQLRSFSKGMLQRIGIAQALIHRPEFIILDEPMSGLDPDGRMMVTNIIRETAAAGTTVFFSSHLLHDAEMICQRLVIMKEGHIIMEGPMENLLSQFQKGFRLLYSKDSRMHEEVLAEKVSLNKRIDELRKDRADIVEIRFERPSLEEAFVKVSQEGTP